MMMFGASAPTPIFQETAYLQGDTPNAYQGGGTFNAYFF